MQKQVTIKLLKTNNKEETHQNFNKILQDLNKLF